MNPEINPYTPDIPLKTPSVLQTNYFFNPDFEEKFNKMQKIEIFDDNWSTNSSLDFLYAQEPKPTLVNEVKRQTRNISNFIESKILEAKCIIPDCRRICDLTKIVPFLKVIIGAILLCSFVTILLFLSLFIAKWGYFHYRIFG